jgi:hypothetical protein
MRTVIVPLPKEGMRAFSAQVPIPVPGKIKKKQHTARIDPA